MKIVIITVSILMLLAAIGLAQAPDTAWVKYYHRGSTDIGYSIVETDDGGFLIAGTSQQYDASYLDIWLVRIDQNGDSLWAKTYSYSPENNLSLYAYSLRNDPNGGYVIGGMKQMSSSANNPYVLKIDENGDSLWSFSMRRSDNCEANFIACTNDSGYVLVGYAYTSGSINIFALKLDSQGDSCWVRYYDHGNWEQPYVVEQTSDGGFIIGGKTNYNTSGSFDYYVVKADALGNAVWSDVYGGDNYDYCNAIQPTPDGGYILYGEMQVYSSAVGLAIKTDSIGQIEWQHTYTGPVSANYGRSVDQCSDGGYIFGGHCNVTYNYEDFYFIKTDANGDTLWTKAVGNSYDEDAYCVLQASDGSYLLVGHGFYSIDTDGDALLVKLNAEPTSIEDKHALPSLINVFGAYPNPFNAATTIRFELPAQSNVVIDIYDLLGRKVANAFKGIKPAGYYQITWQADDYSSGLYFYRIGIGSYSKTGKMILLK